MSPVAQEFDVQRLVPRGGLILHLAGRHAGLSLVGWFEIFFFVLGVSLGCYFSVFWCFWMILLVFFCGFCCFGVTMFVVYLWVFLYWFVWCFLLYEPLEIKSKTPETFRSSARPPGAKVAFPCYLVLKRPLVRSIGRRLLGESTVFSCFPTCISYVASFPQASHWKMSSVSGKG